MPTVENSRPIAAAMKPMRRLPLDSTEMIVSPKIPSQKYSGGPNLSDISASGSAEVARTMLASTLPTNDANAAVTSACWAMPLRASGNPSKVVAMAAGVPGVLMRIAGIASPYIAPT